MSVRVLLMAGSMEIGGSEQQTLLLLQHLNREQFQPELYLSRRCGELLESIPEDVPIHAFSDTGWTPSLEWPHLNWPGRTHRRTVRHLRELTQSRQIDLVYDRTFHMSLLACGLPRSVPRVATIVSPPDRDLPHSEAKFLALKRSRLRRSYQRARRVVCVSNAVRQSAIDYYRLPATAAQTVYSPVDVARLRADSERPLPRNPAIEGLADRSLFHIACIGRMTREKGQDVLLGALAAMRDQDCAAASEIRLWLIGDGPERGELESQASRLGLNDQVHFLGQLAYPASVLARTQLLVCPSRHEGLPNAVLEAFACEVPVIATRVGGTPELLRGVLEEALVEPNNPHAMAMAILRAQRDDSLRASWVEHAAERVATQFSLRGYLDTMHGLFAEVIG